MLTKLEKGYHTLFCLNLTEGKPGLPWLLYWIWKPSLYMINVCKCYILWYSSLKVTDYKLNSCNTTNPNYNYSSQFNQFAGIILITENYQKALAFHFFSICKWSKNLVGKNHSHWYKRGIKLYGEKTMLKCASAYSFGHRNVLQKWVCWQVDWRGEGNRLWPSLTGSCTVY